MTLERVYKSSPRVRAKLLVATQISMNQFLAGEAILRQQLSEIAGTGVARIQLEFLQTSALRESDRGIYFAAFGISALPDPPADRTGSSSTSSTTYNITGGSATATVSYIKRSTTTTSTRGALGLYTPSRDAYQSLRLRFLFAKTLLPLQLGTSDILIRETRAAPSDAYYSSSASVLEIELHLNDEAFRVAVDGYLRNGSLAQEFNAIEPQWTIGAIDVDPLSGILYSPPSSSSSTSGTTGMTTASMPVNYAIDVAFVLNNVSFAHVASRKWRILERVAQFLSLNGCDDCQVSVKDVVIPPGDDATAATHNDGDRSTIDAVISSALDPTNAPSTTLSFRTDTLSSNISSFMENLQSQVASSPSTALCVAIGVQEENETELSVSSADAGMTDDDNLSAVTCALSSYQNGTQLSPQFTLTTEPFVLLNLTLGLTETTLNASVTMSQVAASLFEQFRFRCALLVLLQQVAVYNKHLHLEATSLLPVSSVVTAPSTEPLLLLAYKVTIEDESQRQGIASLFLSKRLQRTIDEYTNQRLGVLDRVADLHADGSHWLGAKLPGITLSTENEASPALLRSGPDSTVPSNGATTRVYRFQDPLEGSNPSVLTFADPTFAPSCPPAAINASLQCLSIQFASDFESNALFLREIESNVDVSSPSLVLPNESQLNPVPAAAMTNVPAPWIYNASSNNRLRLQRWHFVDVVLRFHFEFAAEYVSTTVQSNPTTLSLDVRVEDVNSSDSGGRRIAVRKSSFLPLVASTGGNSSSAYGHSHFNPFVTAQVASNTTTAKSNSSTTASNSSGKSSVNSVELGVTFHIHRSSPGGFFNRAWIASEPSASSSLTLCSIYYAKLEACDASLECRALSSCFSAYADSNPTLYASLLLLSASGSSSSSSPVTHDVSWLLEQCLGGGRQTSENWWTYSVLLQFIDGLLCTSSAQCPVETSAAIAGSTNSSSFSDMMEAGDPDQSLVLRYTPMEQTLTFSTVDFSATLEFLIATEEDADTDGGTPTGVRSQVFSNLTRDESSLSALGEMLMGLYRGQQSSLSGNNSSSEPFVKVVRGDSDSSSSTNGSEAEVLRIQYFSLPTWTSCAAGSDVSRSELLPYVQTVLGDSPVVETVSPVESLELVVVDS